MSKSALHCLVIATLATSLCACGGGSGGGNTAATTASVGGSSSGSSTAATATDVTTYHNDTLRSGQNLSETRLTPASVNSSSFGLLKILPADGVVDATPLVASNVSIAGVAHNVVYVATENDSVYAYDLNSYAQLAKVSLLASGETAASTAGGCTQVAPQIGVTSTGVIDRTAGPNGTLFVVAMSQDSAGNTVHRLHALDLTTLADRIAPVAIQATYAGTGPESSNGVVTFSARQYKERSALLLSGGQIYTSWASNCDDTPYTSWIIAYSEALAQTQVLNMTPNGAQGAIWNSGGVLADSSGSLYALLGNGTFDGGPDYGNAMVRLTSNGSTLSVADYFTPLNTVTASAADMDFGSGSPMLIPNQTDAAGTVHQLVFGVGKDTNAFLMDTANLGKFNATVNQVFQEVAGLFAGGVWAAPAYYNGTIYLGAVNGPLQALTLTNAMLPGSPSSQSAAIFGYPGASPAISANGTSTGIVWAVNSSASAAAVLHAYNPGNLAQEYYNSTQAASGRDSFGNGNKFITPVIADGEVFVGTPSGVAVFGLL